MGSVGSCPGTSAWYTRIVTNYGGWANGITWESLLSPPQSPNSGRPSGLETSKPHGGQGSANLSLACGICRCACGHLVRFPARGTEEPKVDGSGRQGARPLGTAGVAALRKGTDQMGKGRACSVPPARSAGHNYLSV